MKNWKTIFAGFMIFFIACEKDQDDYIEQHKNAILQVYTSTTNAEADGKSPVKIVASITKTADLKAVGFHVSYGVFQDNGKDSVLIIPEMNNDSLQAITYLIPTVDVTSNVILRVSVPEVDTVLLINFVNAFADSIHMEATMGALASDFNSETTVTTGLFRNTGAPSLHQKVYFHAITEKNDSIGDFRAISPMGSDSNGLVSGIFQLKDTLYKGTVRIYATYMGKSQLLTDTTRIFIIKK